MLGVFDLNFESGDEQIDVLSVNHLTDAGMAALFNLQKLKQPNVTAPNTALYSDTINYFFVITDNGEPLGFDLNDKGITFDKIKHYPNSYNKQNLLYDAQSASTGNIGYQLYPEGQDSIKVIAAGMGYKEVGGDGSKDFVWSITPLKAPVILNKSNEIEYPERPQVWRVTYAYRLVLTGNIVPEIKFNIAGENYTFIRDPMANEKSVGYFTTSKNLLERRDNDRAAFTINGARFAAPSDFKEIKTDNPLIRKFEITYTNRRATNSCDLTGFSMMIGGNIFGWRLEHGRYIVLEAGKKFKVTVTIGIENGNPAAINVNNINYAPTPYYESELGEVSVLTLYNLDNIKMDTVYLTGSANTSKEQISVKKLVGDENFVYIGDIPKRAVFNDELTKIEFGLGGVKGRPLYILLGGNASVINMEQPDISAADCGWRYENDKIAFRINVPADITHLQCALDDGIWVDFPVIAGQSNDLTLTKPFFYNYWMFLRWKNGDKTGKIVKFNKTLVTGGLIVEPYYHIYENTRNSNPNDLYYQTVSLSAAGYGSTNNPGTIYVDSNYGTFSYGISGTIRGAIPGSSIETNYNSPFTGKSVTLLATNDYLNNNLTLVKEPAFANFPAKSTGRQADLSWQTQPVRPSANDVAVSVTNPNIPRSLILQLKAYPTAEAPSFVRIQATSQTRRARIRRLHDNQVIATVESPLVGQLLEFKITDKLMNHLDYGVEYIDASDVSLSPAPVVFRGGSLDIPAQITDYAYDDVNYIISFTTPDRAVRASIKQFDIEVFSFECVPNGVTKFYMSKPLNMTQRYELWCYNANGETWDEPYVMVDNEETDEKPTSTGPYLFPEWANPEPTDVVTDLTGTETVFADIQRWVREGMVFDATINGQKTDKLINRNTDGLIMSIRFNYGMQTFIWYTGYVEGQVSYNLKPVNSSTINVQYMSGTQPFRIDAWHEWEKYSYIDEASFGQWRQGPAFVPYYGQTKGKFQKTEIINGYIRNTLRILYKPGTQPRVCPMYHLQPTNYSDAFRSASIYLHIGNIVGSLNLGKTFTDINSVQPIIDGKAAKWEYTLNDAGNVEGILRCFNDDQIAFRFDTADWSKGWICENYDPELEDQPGSDAIYHTLEFCANSTDYWGGSVMSYSATSLDADKPANADGEFGRYRYSQAIFAKVNPYAAKQSFDTEFGDRVTTLEYWENNPSSVNREELRFRDAFVNVPEYAAFALKVVDSFHYIHGERATLTREEVTLTYTPKAQGNIGAYYNNINPNQSWPIQNPELVPFTYSALVVTTPSGFVVSNRSNPFIWTLDSKPAGVTDKVIKVVFGRRQFTEEFYGPYELISSDTAKVSGGVFHSLTRKYWSSMSFAFHTDVEYRLLKTEEDRPDPSQVVIDESKSRWDNKVLHKLIADLSNQGFIYESELGGFKPIEDLLDPSEEFVIVDGRPFTIQFNPAIPTELAFKKFPYLRDMTIYAARIVDAANENIYFEVDFRGNMHSVGITPGIHRISFGGDNGVATWMLDVAQSFTLNLKEQSLNDLGMTVDEYGFVEVSAFNYIVSDVATGSMGSISLMPITILDPATRVEQFTPDFGPSFTETASFQAYIDLPTSTNPYFGTASGQPLTIKLNGVPYDSTTTFTNKDIVPDVEEGQVDNFERSDMSLLMTRLYVWETARVVVRIEHYPDNARAYIHLDSLDTDMRDPVENYTGDQMHFEFLSSNPVKWGEAWPFVALGGRQISYYGLPIGTFNRGPCRVQSVANGDEIWTRMEWVIGRAPIVDEDRDPSIPESYYTGVEPTYLWNSDPSTLGNGAVGGPPILGRLGPGPRDVEFPFQADAILIPNWVQFPYTRFEVLVNGKLARFVAPAPIVDAKYSQVTLNWSDEFKQPRNLNDPSPADLNLRRVILKDGSLEPLGEIPFFYDRDFRGPGGQSGPMMMAAAAADEGGLTNPPIADEDIAGIYIADIDPAIHLDKEYDFEGIPAIIVGDYETVIVWDPILRDWRLYTGNQMIPYLIEFRYKRPWTPSNDEASIAIDSSTMNQRNFETNFNFLTANNVRVEVNEVHTDKLNISWVNLVKPWVTDEPVAGMMFKGIAVPRAPKFREYYPNIAAMDDTLFRCPISKVTAANTAFTINDVPAVVDLTNYSADDSEYMAEMIYTITEVAANNVYPALGSKGNFTIKTADHTVRYDVATGTWSVIQAVNADEFQPIDVGIICSGSVLNLPPRNSCVYGRQYQSNPAWSTAIVFSILPHPTTPYDPEAMEYPPIMDHFLNFDALSRNPVVPNYELFNLSDFELRFNDVVITPEVVNDTHGVPEEWIYKLDPAVDFELVINKTNRQVIWSGPSFPEGIQTADYGILPRSRSNRLSESRFTKYFYDQIMAIFEWRYKLERDITDPRPLWLGMNNSNQTEFTSMFDGITGRTLMSGTKKLQSVVFGFVFDEVSYMNGNQAERMIYGYQPTLYTGPAFTIEGNEMFIMDSKAPRPLVGPPERDPIVFDLFAKGLTNYEPS